ncbi:HD domain-containing protein [Weissella kandleri]|uniref:HD domain-containing protein n=1 Tax=Weissella kandleri TaxID=1616 RepID=UPI00387ED4B4
MNLDEIKDYVQTMTRNDSSGHDFLHLERVLKNAEQIMQKMPDQAFDADVVRTTVLLHDLIDEKLIDDVNQAIDDLRVQMREWGLSDDERAAVLEIMTHMSYSANLEQHYTLSTEGQIVQDADRLDALGALGIGRTFMYGGYAGNLMYNPNEAARKDLTHDEYRKNSTVINHFYEKLLKLADLMNTESAREIAKRRTAFMEFFLDEFKAEVQGER